MWLIFEGVAGIFILGMYPFMVKDYLEKKEISFKEAFSFSRHKFGSLLGAYLFVGLIIVLINMVSFSFMPLFPIIVNTVRGIVECLILVLFCYSASAIIMDNVGAWEGIKKSVGVAKRNYPLTFLILLIPTIVGIALGEIVWEMHFGVSATIYEILLIVSVIYLFVGAWVKITIPYVYYNLKLSNTSNVQHA